MSTYTQCSSIHSSGNIINCTLAGLRGFCGINQIYINAAYIRGQLSIYSTEYRSDSPIEKSVTEMDICTITIHEFGHARLRQVNMVRV